MKIGGHVSVRARSSLCTTVTAIGLATGIMTVAATQPESIAPLLVSPAALIVGGSSTNQGGAGVADFFGGRFKPANADDIFVVPFSAGPTGFTTAVQQHTGSPNVILSSGWGAAYASVALSNMFDVGDPALKNTLWVIDNNVVTPNGGFGTRYPLFSGLTGVPTQPTRTDTGVPVVSTAYEYDVNSNAPKYVLNAFAVANTLIAYFQRRLTQATLELPVNDDGSPACPGGASSCTVTVADGTADGIVAHVTKVGSVTYVTYEPTDGLPLVAPLRLLGAPGNLLADVLEPAMTALVNWGYPNNDPIGDPNEVQPGRLIPSVGENLRFIQQFVTGIAAGLARLAAPPAPASTPAPLSAATVSAAEEVSATAAMSSPADVSPSAELSVAASKPEARPEAKPAAVESTSKRVEPSKPTSETVETNVVRESPNYSPGHDVTTAPTPKPDPLETAVAPKAVEPEKDPPSTTVPSTDPGSETSSASTSSGSAAA